jgi:mannan endo-1,4-beta-mannosidase
LSGLYRRRDIEGARKYLSELAQNGVNVLRLMLEYAHVDGRYFERPSGRFNPAMVRLWDDLFALCEEAGLRVLLAPWDNFWMARRWHKHPYNRANGGPAENPAVVLPRTRRPLPQLRIACASWPRAGGSVLCAWDLFNEIHPHWGGSPSEQSARLGALGASDPRGREACARMGAPADGLDLRGLSRAAATRR